MMTIQTIVPTIDQPVKATMTMPATVVTRTLYQWLSRKSHGYKWLRSMAFRIALDQAYQRFEEQHSVWANMLCDKSFLGGSASLLVTCYFQEETFPTAEALAVAWDKQLGPASPAVRARRITEITPALADFLTWFNVALDH